MPTDPFEFISDDLTAMLARYEKWAFGTSMTRGSRSALAKVPSRYNEPGFWSGRFHGCTRHNDYIEKWDEYRSAIDTACTNGMAECVDEQLLKQCDRLFEDLKYLNTQAAEAEFWSRYRKKTEQPGAIAWSAVVLVIAAIIGIAFSVALFWLVPVFVLTVLVFGYFRRRW